MPALGLRVLLILALSAATARLDAQDWAQLKKFAAANGELGAPAPDEDRVVLIGDSIFESWAPYFGTMFPNQPYVPRGISGQTTPQILVRFRQDVVALKPKVVVILAGTNDIAGNTGPSTLEMIGDNIASMAELAKANGIRVVIASVLPADRYAWRPELRPAKTIVALNDWIRRYARGNGFVYLDYHGAMSNEQLGLRRELSGDGVHPNEAGYSVMAPLTEAAIQQAMLAR